MATMEVHDGQGRVQFIELERSTPYSSAPARTARSSSKGRGSSRSTAGIRFKSGRFKVEASPDAEFVMINGHRMANGSIDLGDEIAVGPCRLFLLRMDQEDVTRRSRAGRPPSRRAAPP